MGGWRGGDQPPQRPGSPPPQGPDLEEVLRRAVPLPNRMRLKATP